MAAVFPEAALRGQLVKRRERLEGAVAARGRASHLVHLLHEVDAALERLDDGSFGICAACHDAVEPDRMLADPLVRLCLDHLTPEEQRALERDLEAAARIQASLLPRRDLAFAGWEVHYRYEPAGPVSGDYCDLVPRPEGDQLFFLFGDVSGKGVSASILMAHLQAIFRSLIALGLPLTELAERANRLFAESTLLAHYATLVMGRADGPGAIEICNAGHCPPLLARRDGVERLEATGLPVGLFTTGPYSAQRLDLAPGDTLLLYTDGLSEARNARGEEYGVERVATALARRRGEAPAGVVRACLEDLAAFQGGARRSDDLTVMAIRRAG